MTLAEHDIPVTGVSKTQSRAWEAWARILRKPLSLISLIVVGIYVLIGLASFAPVMEKRIETPVAGEKTFAAPAFYGMGADGTRVISPARWCGLDIEGRSVLWQVCYGTRIALLIMICTSALSISIGTALGLLAGYFGGSVDDLITWLYSTVSSVPWLLLVIAMAYVIQNIQSVNSNTPFAKLCDELGGLPTVVIALGLTDWVGLCRLIRGEVIKLRDQDFVVAARAMGLGGRRIMTRHILPNTFHIVLITFSLSSVGYVQAETVLAFLGLGITTKPSWGKMIDDSRLELLQGVWWQFAAATVAILILCLALNVLGDALRDALDPKLRGVK
jgi:ABC-type dipeptide/oligopeptide/nickel transport system permease subunit